VTRQGKRADGLTLSLWYRGLKFIWDATVEATV